MIGYWAQFAETGDPNLPGAPAWSPYSVVTDQFQFQGEFIGAGSKLVTIADLSEIIVKTQVADNVVAQLKVGDPARVLPADLPGQSLPGKVSLISQASDPVSRTVEVWVGLKNDSGQLRSGSAAQVVVVTKQAEDAVVVPASAVTLDSPDANAGTVMVIDPQSIAHATRVTTGVRTPQAVQVTAGLQGGETVVIEGNYALPDGTKVALQAATPTPAASAMPAVSPTPAVTR